MPSPIHNRANRGSRPASNQILTNAKGDAGPGKQAKDGRANTQAGGDESRAKPWFESDPTGSTKDWRAGQ